MDKNTVTLAQNTDTAVPGMFYIDPALISRHIDVAVQQMVQQGLDQLVQDAAWLDKIQNMVTAELLGRLSDKISHIDINTVVHQNIDTALDRYHDRLTQQNFSSKGIKDQASQCELVVSDGAVVAQSGLACQELLVAGVTTTQDLKVNNLAVTGTINTDCASWQELIQNMSQQVDQRLSGSWKTDLVQQVLDLARVQGIDFQTVTVNGKPIVDDGKLNAHVIESSLQKVGKLRDLEVTGISDLADTMLVANRRVGINTRSPDMALSVWDEEVSLSFGKLRQDRAWMGSTRQIALDIGVNRKPAISIDPDGLVTVNELRLDRWRIAFANQVPNHSGTRGDLVFNHDPKPDSPWAWQCLGGFRWQPLGR